MNFMRASSGKLVAGLAGTVALAAGLAAGGAFGAAPPTAAINAVDDDWQLVGGSGRTATIALGGKVTFAYPEGFDEHNARFVKDGVACTQTGGLGSVVNGKALPAETEEPGWTGDCVFTQPGDFAFVCDVHPLMQGKVVVVDEGGGTTTTPPTTTGQTTSTTTTPTTPGGGGTTPGGGTAPVTVPPATTDVPATPVIRIARTQRGTVLRGTLAKGGKASKVVIDVRALRGAVRAPGKRTALVSVGKLTRRTSATGGLTFAIKLDARARGVLKRAGRLALNVRVTVTLPLIGAQTETFTTVIRSR
jgi:plastocyanin